MRLVFEFEDIEGPGEQEPGIFKAGDADLVALVNYGQHLADEMSGAFPFRFGDVYTEAGMPPTGPRSEGDAAEAIAGLRGSMAGGYAPEDVNRVLGRISDVCGLRLVCVWDIYDSCGPGGNSEFYIEESGGRLMELTGDLWRYLSDDPGGSEAPSSPGHPGSWAGEPAGFTAADLGWGDGFCNYAVRDAQSPVEPGRGPADQPAVCSGLTAARTVTGATASGPVGGIVLTRDQIREWTGLDLTPTEMDRLASCIPGSSIPDAIGTIVAEAMGLSGPAEEEGIPSPVPSRAHSRAAAGSSQRRRGAPVDPARRPSR